jgi:hypothetical protein
LKLLGASKRKPFFRFHNQEIATLYDPPTSWIASETCSENMMCSWSLRFWVMLCLGAKIICFLFCKISHFS